MDRQKVELSLTNERIRREYIVEKIHKLKHEYDREYSNMQFELERLATEIANLEDALICADRFISENELILNEVDESDV